MIFSEAWWWMMLFCCTVDSCVRVVVLVQFPMMATECHTWCLVMRRCISTSRPSTPAVPQTRHGLSACCLKVYTTCSSCLSTSLRTSIDSAYRQLQLWRWDFIHIYSFRVVLVYCVFVYLKLCVLINIYFDFLFITVLRPHFTLPSCTFLFWNSPRVIRAFREIRVKSFDWPWSSRATQSESMTDFIAILYQS